MPTNPSAIKLIAKRSHLPMADQTATISQLRKLVQRASRAHPHLTFRLEKAAFLVLLRPIQAIGEAHYLVRSEDGLRDYRILNGHCECSDYVRHGRGHPCKHRIALLFYEELDNSTLP